MSDSNPRDERAQVLIKTARDAAQKNNLDYAISMYREALKTAPENVPWRQELRKTERRRFEDNPNKVGRLVGAKNHPIRLRAKTAKAKGQWTHVLEVCEEAFYNNPWDITATEDAADAAERLGLKELAEWLMESVERQALEAKNAEFFRHMAHTHGLNEHWQKAILAWEKVKKINPSDEEAGRQINSLSANATIARSGLSDAISKATTKASAEAQGPDPEELKREAMSPEDRLLKEIQEQPDRPGAYLHLADHYQMHDRLDDAEKVLAAGLKHMPEDTVLLKRHGEIQISRLRKYIEIWTKRSEANPGDPDARGKLDRARRKLAEYEIGEIRRLMVLRPDDMKLRLQLGQKLAQAGQHDAAIAEFQAARKEPGLAVDALLQAGQSFEAQGVTKLAERSYADALRAIEEGENKDQATINSLHYRLGRLAEAQGNVKVAEDHYNEVAANDYAFMDVAQRLRSLNQGPPT